MEFDRELDACGLNCPLPILRAKKTLDRMESGQVLKVVATDPGSVAVYWAESPEILAEFPRMSVSVPGPDQCVHSDVSLRSLSLSA